MKDETFLYLRKRCVRHESGDPADIGALRENLSVVPTHKSILQPEGRKHVAQCESTGRVNVRREPRYGAKDFHGLFCRPVPGLKNVLHQIHTAYAVGYDLSPFGLDFSKPSCLKFVSRSGCGSLERPSLEVPIKVGSARFVHGSVSDAYPLTTFPSYLACRDPSNMVW